MTTIYEELKQVTKIDRKPAETEQSYLKRLYKKADELSEDEWKALTEKTQVWVNSAGEAWQAKKPLPGLEGVASDAPAASSEVEATEEASEESAPSKPKKAAKKPTVNGSAGAAKPAKAAAKETKAPAKKAEGKPGKKAAAKKENGAKRGRPLVFAPDAKIKLLTKENPFREGSNSHKVFGMYKSGMTVAEFEKAVAKGSWESTPKMFLQVHRGRGLIQIG